MIRWIGSDLHVAKGSEEAASLGSIRAWSQPPGWTLCSGRTGPEQLASRRALPGAGPGCWSTNQRHFPNPTFSLFPEWPPCCQLAWQPLVPPFPEQAGGPGPCQASRRKLRCPFLSPEGKVPVHPITRLQAPKLDYKLSWNKAPAGAPHPTVGVRGQPPAQTEKAGRGS